MSSVEFIKMITAEAKCDGKDSNHSPKGNKLVMRKSLYGIAWRHILPFPLLALRPRDPTNQSRMSFLDLNKAAGVVVLSDHTLSLIHI